VFTLELTRAARAVVDETRAYCDALIDTDVDALSDMRDEDDHALLLEIQKKVNDAAIGDRFIEAEIEKLGEIVGTKDLAAQAICYVRGSCPAKRNEHDAIAYHRETFYDPTVGNAWNIWTPLANHCADNAVRLIPGIQRIPETAIVTAHVDEDANPVKRNSAGHRVGLRNNEKVIVDGVDLSNSAPLLVPRDSYAVFPAILVHGSGVNHSDQIRVSPDFRVIPEADADYSQVRQATTGSYFKAI
jgi:hypothetical protein